MQLVFGELACAGDLALNDVFWHRTLLLECEEDSSRVTGGQAVK
jgi:hypothetical protein